MNNEAKTQATKKTVLVNAYVKAELWTPRWHTDMEDHAKDLESAVKSFWEFIRDHRSQDLTGLEVVREYEDQCSACESKWETMENEAGITVCANCGVPVDNGTKQGGKT